MKPLYIFANWKMYLDSNESMALARVLVANPLVASTRAKLAIFPSALAFAEVATLVADSAIHMGAQNTFWLEKGGYTGEVSPTMYKQLGAEYVLVGHSERRYVFGESNADVRRKVEAVLADGMQAVVCVGETLAEREKGSTEEAIEAQVRAVCTGLSLADTTKPFIIAYEPVWAVSTGNSCDPIEAERVASLIRTYAVGLLGASAEVVVLYGGSVKTENVARYLEQPSINGVLVGNALTQADTWTEFLQQIV